MEPKRIGKYTLHRELGRGQFGIVYLATHNKTYTQFAIKKIHKRKINKSEIMLTLLESEVSIMNDIYHPNILHLHQFLDSKNSYYLVVDYCEKGDLEQHMEKTSPTGFSEMQSIQYLKQMMQGFKELHRHQIMHRDFKLANIFLKSDGTVVIGDFGFAKSGVQMTTTRLGTPLTMAPELIKSSSRLQYTSKADLWSIGVVFYHMLQGEYPFVGMTDHLLIQDILKKVDNMTFKRPISEQAKDLLSKLLVVEPDERICWKDFFNHCIFWSPKQYLNSNSILIIKKAKSFYKTLEILSKQNKNDRFASLNKEEVKKKNLKEKPKVFNLNVCQSRRKLNEIEKKEYINEIYNR